MAAAIVLAALLDPARMRLAGLLCNAVRTTDELEAELALPNRTVLEALAVLREAGLVEAATGGWTIPVAKLRSLAAEVGEADLPMDPFIGYGMADDERLVLSRYFEGRVLVEVPSSRAKRRIVLERLALEFEIGKRYDEVAVNVLLHAFHEDHVTIRRYLVDEGLLDRDDGQYWRSGGRVDVG